MSILKCDYKVFSLVKYIEILETLEEDPYVKSLSPTFYRGESKNYYSNNNNVPIFNASAFREAEKPVSGFEVSQKLPFKEKLDSFRYEVWNEIDDDTRKNFLAYSQHHGMNTNLLDFTDNPLVALFFACHNTDEVGYVYLYKSPVLDITSFFKNNDEKNILDIIITNDNQTVKDLISFFWGFGNINGQFTSDYCQAVSQDIIELLKIGNPRLQLSEDSSCTKLDIDNIIETVLETEPNELIRNEYNNSLGSTHVGLKYLVLIRAFVRLKKDNYEPIASELNGIMPMIYRPSMNFKRGINQNGLFFYQNYIPSKGNIVIAKQKIQPTIKISVSNKEKILTSLDRLNINSKFIYGDHSSIAKYIEENYKSIKDIQKSLTDYE